MLGGIYPGQIFPAGVPQLSQEEADLQDGPWTPTDFRRGYSELVLDRARQSDADEMALLLRRK